MKIQRTTLLYFSPTGGTRKAVQHVALGLGYATHEIDLTLPPSRQQKHDFGPDEAVILGLPVYGGRIPNVDILSCISGQHTPLIALVTYGNRAYDDALIELKTEAERRGFITVAAAAFIAEHSFSHNVATGRPDAEDNKQLAAFGQQVRTKLDAQPFPALGLSVNGHMPYQATGATLPFTPKGDSTCTACGICVDHCPVGAIPRSTPEKTDAKLCINCQACTKICPSHARAIDDPLFRTRVAMLEKNLAHIRHEAEVFI